MHFCLSVEVFCAGIKSNCNAHCNDSRPNQVPDFPVPIVDRIVKFVIVFVVEKAHLTLSLPDTTKVRLEGYVKNQGLPALHKDFIKTIETDSQRRFR
jgi:hypothetical protein